MPNFECYVNIETTCNREAARSSYFISFQVRAAEEIGLQCVISGIKRLFWLGKKMYKMFKIIINIKYQI